MSSSSPSTSTATAELTSNLPIREIPGSYGIPFISPIKDRLDYYYNQGTFKYFSSRATKYNSTVYRANMPPGPFIASDPRVIVLLDAKSFPILFDVSKVEKRDVFTGTYVPSTSLAGGYRALSYLDPSEEKHTLLKQLLFTLLSSRRQHFIPEFHRSFSNLFDSLEAELKESGKADFNTLSDAASFAFLSRAYFDVDVLDTKIGSQGPTLATKWLFLSLYPLIAPGILPKNIEDFLLHTFPLPFFLVKNDYQKLYNFFSSSASAILNEAERIGLKRDEACNNILFATCFNSFGGMKVFFPALVKYIAFAGESLHRKLVDEIRSTVRATGGQVTFSAIENMPLTKSVVYEALRVEPPVMFQYAKAKQDLIIESHDAAFKIKKGEMLFGFQPFATRDPKVFSNGEDFIPDRFIGDGAQLLKYVLWSNGPETESATLGNKQCAGKDFVVLIGRLLVVELFLRYDTFTAEIDKSVFGTQVKVTSLKKASGN